MDTEALLALQQQRYKELVADPDSPSAVTVRAMSSASTERDLLRCMFSEEGVQALESAFSGEETGENGLLSAVVSKSLQYAHKEQFPLHTLANGVFKDLRRVNLNLLPRDFSEGSRAFEDVVTTLSPPTHCTVLPANQADRPQHIDPIEYVYADGAQSSTEGEVSDDGVKYYARLMRDLVSQPVSARRSREAAAAGSPPVYVLSADWSSTYGVPADKQELLQALNDSKTPTEFVMTLASHGNEDHLKAMERYLAAGDGTQSFDQFLAETLTAEMAHPGAYEYIPVRDRPAQGTTSPPPETSIPDLESSGSTIDDGDQGFTTDDERAIGDAPEIDGGIESEGESEFGSEDESDHGDDVDVKTHPTSNLGGTAFARNTTLWSHLVEHPHGRVGARDVSYLETIPCAIRDLGKTLFLLAAHWKRSQVAQSSGGFTDMGPSDIDKYLNDRTAAIDNGQKRWTELMREVGRARTNAINQAGAFLSAAGRHAADGGELTTVMPSVHPNDSDRHESVISYLHGVSAKLLNGWRLAKIDKVDETNAADEDLSTTRTDVNEDDGPSTKRALSRSPDDKVDNGKRVRTGH